MARAGAGRYWLIWAAVLPILVWAVVRVLGVEGGYPLVPLLAYTPYVAFVAVLVAGVAVALRNWAAALVGAVAVAFLLSAVLPRAIGSGDSPPPGASELRILSTNVHVGTADPERLVGLVQRLDPDVLVVQELTPRFTAKLEHAGIRGLLPEVVRTVQPTMGPEYRPGGSGIYSRSPLRRLPAPESVAFRMPRAMVTLDNGRRVRIVDVHPLPPKKKLVGRWRTQLATLPPAERRDPPWVLAGDFNATLDFPELRDVLDTGYRDAGEVTGKGLEPTWPSGRIFPPPVTIDHVLAGPGVAILDYAVEDLEGSDHRAVFARLAIP